MAIKPQFIEFSLFCSWWYTIELKYKPRLASNMINRKKKTIKQISQMYKSDLKDNQCGRSCGRNVFWSSKIDYKLGYHEMSKQTVN